MERKQPSAIPTQYWEPFWCARSLLAGLSLLFVVLLATLLALLETCRSANGLKAANSIHYVYTYAPTAILILLSATWRQIDFHCKQLIPWNILHKGESSAEASILLDYVSPLQIKSFIRALKNRHWPVACTIAAFAILKVLTVASTALFTTVHFPRPLTAVTVQKVPLAEALDVDLNELRAIGPAIAFEAFGISSQGLAQRAGLTDTFIYETLNVNEYQRVDNFTIQASARGLSPIFECQDAPFQVIFPPSNTTDFNPDTRVELSFPECTLRGGNGRGTAIYSLNPSISKVPARQLSPLRQQVDCLDQTTENWQLLTLVDFRYSQTLDDEDLQATLGDSVRARSWSTTAANVVGVVCRSIYRLGAVELSYSDAAGDERQLRARGISMAAGERLADFVDADVGDIVDSALRAGASMAGRLEESSFDEDYPNTLFKIMAGIANGTYDRLLDGGAMVDAAQTAYQHVALQALDRHLRASRLVPISATLTTVETRLRVNEVAAIVSIAGFGLLSMLSAALLFLAPRGVAKHDPELLSSAAIILHDSPVLQRTLLRTKTLNMKLRLGLRGFKFASGSGYSQLPQARCGILTSKDGEASPLMSTERGLDTPDTGTTRWYRPATTRKRLLCPLLALPLAIIGALEAVQQFSDKNDGVTVVANPSSPVIMLLPQVLSALIMLCVAAAFSSIEFNVLLLSPVHLLHRGQGSASEGLLTAYLGRVPPVVLLGSFVRRHWAVMLVTISALIGSLLTLVASALYTFKEIDRSQPLGIQQLNQMDTTWANSASDDSDASVVYSLVESTNLGFPEFTYDELAFPTLQADAIQVQNVSQTTLLEASVPALRAALNCTVLEASAYNFTSSFNSRVRTASAQISASIPLVPDCQFGGSVGNESTLDFTSSVTMTSNASYIGKLLDLHVGPYDTVRGAAVGELNPSRQPDNPSSCPTLAFWYGHASLSDSSQSASSLLVCYQHLEVLNTTITFTLPNMSISLSHAPLIDDISSRPVFYPNSTSSNTPYRLQLHFDNTFASRDTFITNPPAAGNAARCTFRNPASESSNATFDLTNPALDPFFQGVLCGAQPALPVEMLALTDASSRDRVFTAVHAFYRRYMAVATSKNMRVPLIREDVGDADPILIGPAGRTVGRVVNAGKVVRLVQQSTPKTVVQVMLAVMTAWGGLGVWLCRLWRPVVQYDPSTVAGKMVLFAGTGVGEGQRAVWDRVDGTNMVKTNLLSGLLAEWKWRLGWCERSDVRSGQLIWGIEPLHGGKDMKGGVSLESRSTKDVHAQEAKKQARVKILNAGGHDGGWI